MASVTLIPLFAAAASISLPPSPEGSGAWFQLLEKLTLRTSEQALCASLRDSEQRPICALPVVRDSSDRLRALTCPFSTIYLPNLGSQESAFVLGQKAARFVRSSLVLDCLDPDDTDTAALLKGLKSSGLLSATYFHFENWFEDIGDFERYWATRSSQLRATVKRRGNYLARHHRVNIQIQREPHLINEALNDYEEVYRDSWKQAEPYPTFMRDMCQQLSQCGSVRIATLKIDDEPAASQIWLLGNARITIFKLAHKNKFAELSVGTVLTYEILRSLITEIGPAQVDFGRGSDPYKRNWLNKSRPRIGLIAANPANPLSWSCIAKDILPTRIKTLFQR